MSDRRCCVYEVLSYLHWEFLIHCLRTHNQHNTNIRQGGVVFSSHGFSHAHVFGEWSV